MDLQGRENRRMQFKCSYQLKLPGDKAMRPEHAMLREKKQCNLKYISLEPSFSHLLETILSVFGTARVL